MDIPFKCEIYNNVKYYNFDIILSLSQILLKDTVLLLKKPSFSKTYIVYVLSQHNDFISIKSLCWSVLIN